MVRPVEPRNPCIFRTILIADWTAPLAHSGADRIGLFKAGAPDDAFVSTSYVYGGGMRAGAVGLPANDAGVGPYELRYFFAGTNRVTAVSRSFRCDVQ